MNNLLIKPHITEKTVKHTSRGVFTFLIKKEARKEQIKTLIEKLFNVNVVSIKTISIKGEVKKNLRSNTYYSKNNIKKALVQLKKGQKIDLFDLEESKEK